MIKPPSWSESDIIVRAETLIDDFCRPLGGRRALVREGLQFDRVYEDLIYPRYAIKLDESEDLGVDEDGQKIFGFFEPSTNTAYVDVALRKDPRRPFTLWHEVGGHGVLQGDWLRKQMKRAVTTEQDLTPATVNILERQANLFASNAAAPLWLVDAMIVRVFRPTKPFLYFEPCSYWLEKNGFLRRYHVFSFDDLCQTIAWQLQPYFGYLSKEALGYRIRESGWVIDSTKPILKLFRKQRHKKIRPELVTA